MDLQNGFVWNKRHLRCQSINRDASIVNVSSERDLNTAAFADCCTGCDRLFDA